jgi:hypothetical protein
MSMVAPVGGDAGDPGAPTTYPEDVRSPWEAVPEIRKHPPPSLKTSRGRAPWGSDLHPWTKGVL